MQITRPMPARDMNESNRAATALELFFDLVAVIAIASVTAQFHHAISAGHGLELLTSFLFVFTGIWWAWMNFTWFASGFDNDDGLYRAFTVVIMAGFLGFAAGVEYFFETFDFTYSLIGWVVMRVGMMGLWLRAALHNPDKKPVAMRNFWGLAFAQALWIGYVLLVPISHSLYLFLGLLVFLVEFSVPVFATRVGVVPWHRHHIIERYGLLNTIVLGEVLLSVSFMLSKLYVSEFDAALMLGAISGMVTVFIVWWIYFLEHEHLIDAGKFQTFLWGYGHLAIFASGALLAVGLGVYFDVLTHHSKVGLWEAGAIINVAVAVYFGTLWAIRDAHHRLGLRRSVLPIAALVLLVAAYLGLGPHNTALICLGTLALRIPLSKVQEQ